jgi:hypothetical protein
VPRSIREKEGEDKKIKKIWKEEKGVKRKTAGFLQPNFFLLFPSPSS